MRKLENKPQLHLVYPSLLTNVAKVREYGVAKHGTPTDWQERLASKDISRLDYCDAALRHMLQATEAEAKNNLLERYDESTYLHLAHAACNIMFLLEDLQARLKLPIKLPQPKEAIIGNK